MVRSINYPDREGGELRSKGPTGGKVKQGITVVGGKEGRDSELTNRVIVTSASAEGSIVMRQTGCRLFGFQFGKKGWNRGTV